MSYDECTIESLRTQLSEAIVRAEAAEALVKWRERERDEWKDLAKYAAERGDAVEKRLAERDASAKRWVRLGCVLALLLPFAAHAQQLPSLESQVNADAATMGANDTRSASIRETWRLGLIQLGNQRDTLKAQNDVQTKWIEDAKKVYPDVDEKIAALKGAKP